ncbi:proteasome assembly chaperone 2 [Stylonychia lemnae]|uniref:Proteasome assembly chaperone 2 n=1 Tax=Stylonychia lemnae TaxID=5949 RepID=A0A078B209_STYLE|nr:proteasome assembly chaperone 2 [Stylonychia lemnae]|eukprot:CDW88539.1 proteasome assembly chaperone 2 [Stylonychia lemnae]
MIVQPFGATSSLPDLAGSTLVIPCQSAGLSSNIGVDLYVINEGLQKIGYYKSQYIAAGLSNDGLSTGLNEGNLTLPAEVYFNASTKVTALIIRSGIYSGKGRLFEKELTEFIKKSGFSRIVVLTSTLSPVNRERDSNRQIPELFGYVNKHVLATQPKYFADHGLKQFGFWLGDSKQKEFQELDELMMSGSAKTLMKLFNKLSIPAHLFVMFTSGGIDFVGGYVYFQFLRNNLFEDQSSLVQHQLGKLNLDQLTGEGIHEKLFVNNDTKIPAYWRQIVSYF